MRFGIYYSGGLDWTFEPRPIRGIADGSAAVPSTRLRALRRCPLPRTDRARAPECALERHLLSAARGALWRLAGGLLRGDPGRFVNDRFLPSPRWLVRALRCRHCRGRRCRSPRAWCAVPTSRWCHRGPPHCGLPHARVRELSRAKSTSGKRRAASRTRSAMNDNEERSQPASIPPSWCGLRRHCLEEREPAAQRRPHGDGVIHPRERHGSKRSARGCGERRRDSRHAPVASRRGDDTRGNRRALHREGQHHVRDPARDAEWRRGTHSATSRHAPTP